MNTNEKTNEKATIIFIVDYLELIFIYVKTVKTKRQISEMNLNESRDYSY